MTGCPNSCGRLGCGGVAASHFPKRIGENHWLVSPWMLGTDLLNPDDFFREKCCCASCWWDLGGGIQCGVGHLWLRSDSLARCKPDRGSLVDSSLPRVPSLTNGMTKRTKWDREKKETRNRNKVLITFLFGGFWMHSRMVLKFPDSRWHILTLFTKQAFPASASKTQPYWEGQS